MLNNQYILMDTKPEIDVVLFCGGGGADTGIEQATPIPVDKEDVFAVHPPVARVIVAANLIAPNFMEKAA